MDNDSSVTNGRSRRPTAPRAVDPLDGVVASLYELHLRAHSLPEDSFRHWLASHVGLRLGARAAWVIDAASPAPSEAAACWEQVRVAAAAGETELLVTREVMALVLPDADGLTPTDQRLLLAAERRGFAPRAAERLGLLARHLGLALALNRWEHRVRSNSPSGRLGRAHAVANASGRILQADLEFASLLRRDYAVRRDSIPVELHGAMQTTPTRQVGATTTVDCVPVGAGAWLWMVRPRQHVDALSTRQATVARLFAAGRTYKEIAELLHLAPTTVRRHLQAVYARLGVRRKLELARLLGDAGLDAPVDAAGQEPVISPARE